MKKFFLIIIFIESFFLIQHSAQAQPVGTAQKLLIVDSLSISFFPLRAGNVWIYKILPRGGGEPPDSTISLASRDTVVNGKQYVSMPAPTFDARYVQDAWYRTNGKDSVWKLWDVHGDERFYFAFSNLTVNEIDTNERWFGDSSIPYNANIYAIDTSASQFGNGDTKKITVARSNSSDDQENLLFDERYGQTGYLFNSQILGIAWQMTLIGGTLNGNGFSLISAVNEDEKNVVPVAAALKIFPNPAQHRVVIGLQGIDKSEAGTIAIVDVLGRIVRTEKIIAGRTAATVEVNLENLPEGFYRAIATEGKNILEGGFVVR